MNIFLKYIIYFILGIIIYYLLLNNSEDIVENFCNIPDGALLNSEGILYIECDAENEYYYNNEGVSVSHLNLICGADPSGQTGWVTVDTKDTDNYDDVIFIVDDDWPKCTSGSPCIPDDTNFECTDSAVFDDKAFCEGITCSAADYGDDKTNCCKEAEEEIVQACDKVSFISQLSVDALETYNLENSFTSGSTHIKCKAGYIGEQGKIGFQNYATSEGGLPQSDSGGCDISNLKPCVVEPAGSSVQVDVRSTDESHRHGSSLVLDPTINLADNVISMRSCSAPANAERYIINGEPPPSDINYDDFASTINVSCKQGWEGSATITKCEHPDTYHSRYTLSGCEPQVPIEPEVTIETAPSNDMNLVYLATGTKDNRGCQNYTCKNSENTYDNWLIKIPPCARNLSDSNASCDPEYYTCNNIDTDKTIHSNDDLIKCNNSLCCDNYVCHAHVNESQCEGEKKLLPNKQCRVKTLNAENDCNTDACCNDWSSDTNITELSQLFDEIINFRDLRKTNLGDSKINGEDIRNFLYYKLLDLKAMKDNSEPTLKWILMNKYLEE